jgi:hypothetical protein
VTRPVPMVCKGDRLQLSAEPDGFGFYYGWAERDWRAGGTWSNRTREPPGNAAVKSMLHRTDR